MPRDSLSVYASLPVLFVLLKYFLGPAAPDATAGVQIDIGLASGITSPSIMAVPVVLDAQQLADILGINHYFCFYELKDRK